MIDFAVDLLSKSFPIFAFVALSSICLLGLIIIYKLTSKGAKE
jgi:hypothetical protein